MSKQNIKYVRPVKGMRVPYPHTGKILPEEGALVNFDSFWRRRLMKDKSIEVFDKRPAVKVAPKADVKTGAKVSPPTEKKEIPKGGN